MNIFVCKRDGALVPWDYNKIFGAVMKAANVTLNEKDLKDFLYAVYMQNIDFAELKKSPLSAMEEFIKREKPKKYIVHIEDIQNHVEKILMKAGYFDVAKAYILYRDQRRRSREIAATHVDTNSVIDEYIEGIDWRVKENANIAHSFQGLMLHMSGTVQAKHALEHMPKEIREAHRHGFFHIHDLSMGLTGYCAGWSLKNLIMDGFNCPGNTCSAPASHFDSILGQMINFLGTLQNEWAGAQAFNNVDTLLAPFIRKDNLSYAEVKQSMQKFIYNMNTNSRWGGQSPFTNITLDLKCPSHMANEPVLVGGKTWDDYTYSMFQEEQDMFNKAFLEVMLKGDANEKIFSYPIPTYNVTPDFPWESEVGKKILEVTAKYGVPYFQNFINSDISPEDVRSMCCRLQMDLKELRKKTGGLFGAGDMTGSVGVVTLNLPKMAYVANGDKEVFFSQVKKYAELAKNCLEIKRKIITKYFDLGLYPYTKRYLTCGYKNHFSTIGLVGGHEACLNLIGKGIETHEGIGLATETLNLLRDLATRFQEETGNLYNIEATPAEGTAYRLAKIDKAEYEDVVASGSKNPYYTNSTNLPVGFTANVIEAVEHQDKLQTLYTGGTVFHVYLGESVTDIDALKSLIIKILSKSKMPYVSITPTFSICDDCGYISGEHFECPTCKKECEVYTRVTGFYRPVKRFNAGKLEEYKDRKEYMS